MHWNLWFERELSWQQGLATAGKQGLATAGQHEELSSISSSTSPHWTQLQLALAS